MSINFCKLCGTRLSPNADVCPGCGRRLTPDAAAANEPAGTAAQADAPAMNTLAGRALESNVHLTAGANAPRYDFSQVNPDEIFQEFFGNGFGGVGSTPEVPGAPEVAPPPDVANTPDVTAPPDVTTSPAVADAPALHPTDAGAAPAVPPADEPLQTPAPDSTPQTRPGSAGTPPTPRVTQPGAANVPPAQAGTPPTTPAQPAADPGAAGAPGGNADAAPDPRYAPYPYAYPNAAPPPQYAAPGMPPPYGWYYGVPVPPEQISVGAYLGMICIGAIPFVGLIYLIVQAVSNQWRPNRRNFARGFLAARAILLIALYALFLLIGIFLGGYYYY